ncbi:MAG: hypothetical protein GX575_05530 [Candidatus Anammoximicrobium sp.]|nr:hypothetical protein [Candidatus Anammoximicrobium sp.]
MRLPFRHPAFTLFFTVFSVFYGIPCDCQLTPVRLFFVKTDTRKRQLTGVNDTTKKFFFSGGDAMTRQSSRSARSRKANGNPDKTYKDFPFSPHDRGHWAKRIRGKLHYFGRWGTSQGNKIVYVDDVDASAQQAVDLDNAQRDDLHAGRTPRLQADIGCTLQDLCNEFLTSKLNKVESGELSRHTFSDDQRACARLIR